MRRRDVRAPEEPLGAADCQRGMRLCVDFRDVRPAAVTPRTAAQAARRGAPLARVLASAAITVACVALPARAQAPSPFVPDDHWVHHALRRLDALGLLRAGYDPGTRSVPERQAGRLLLDALGAAAGTPYEGLARAYLQRFVEEFGDGWGEPAREASPFRLAGAAGVGFAAERGGMGAGSGYRNGGDWTGPTPIPASDDVLSAFELRAYAGRYAAGRVAARAWRDSAGLGDAYVLLAAGKVGAWFGRRAAGFGPVAGRGVVLSGAHAFTSGGLALLEGVTLPGPLRHLGPVRVETFLSSVHENGAVAEPWFWAGRLSIQPHRRLVLGVNRAAMFGGDGNPPLSLRDLLYVMIGKHAGEGSEVDNQIAAVDVWYRVPVHFAPIAVYAEWGFEDSAGAWKDVPGIVAGAEVASVPGLPGLSLGIERASFAPYCCGNPIWYRHWRFLDGWADDGRPLGHPLGGHGTEWRLSAGLDPWGARLRLRLEAFTRDRGEENLFAPDRAGESRGGVLHALFRAGPRIELELRALHERGEADWRESRLEATGRWLLP